MLQAGRIFSCLLAGVVCALAQTTPDYLARLPRLQAAIRAEITNGHVSGVSVALVEGNRILYVDGFGLADKKRKIPAARDTVYRAGSISKLFTAMAAMQLVERGQLSIDQPVSELMPGFRIVIPFADVKHI